MLNWAYFETPDLHKIIVFLNRSLGAHETRHDNNFSKIKIVGEKVTK